MRLFLAIDIPDYVKDEILRVSKEIPKVSLKTVENENLHITMHFFGEASENECKLLLEKLGLVKYPKFECSLTNIGSFPDFFNPRVLWIGTTRENVTQLYLKIMKALSIAPEQRFVPHITLARIKFIEDKKAFSEKINRIKIEEKRFLVDAFKLKKSTLTPKGPVYEDIAAFQLD